MAITEEITLPGFKSDIHAFGYQLANLSPVPHELGLELIQPEISYSHIFPESGFISMYRSLNKTMKSIERYSRKNALTWKKMFEEYYATKDSIISAINNPPLPLSSILEGIDKNPDLFDKYRAGLQSMRSWCNEWFESEEVKMNLVVLRHLLVFLQMTQGVVRYPIYFQMLCKMLGIML